MPKRSASLIATDRQVIGAKPPRKGGPDRAQYRVAGSPGLVLRVTRDGSKTWGAWLKDSRLGKWRMMSLGRYPALTLADARGRIAELQRTAAHGAEIFAAIEAANKPAFTFNRLADAYIERHAKKKKRSWQADERMLAKHVRPVLGKVPADAVTRRDIVELLNGIADAGMVVLANRVHALVRKVYSFGVADALLTENPAKGIPQRGRETTRERVLSETELRQFWQGLSQLEPTYADVLRLQLLLGARVGELAGLSCSELGNGVPVLWTVPAARAKASKDIVRPLSGLALQIICRYASAARQAKREPLFVAPPGTSKKKAAPHEARRPTAPAPLSPGLLSKAMKRAADRGAMPAGVTPHDLRRTAATELSALGIPEPVVKRILGHTPPKSDVLGSVYNRHAYVPEMIAALGAWEARILATANSGDDAVPPMLT